MINSYRDILKLIDRKDPKVPRFELNATTDQSASEIIRHLADALRSGECPEGLYLDLTQKKDRENLRVHTSVMEHIRAGGFNPFQMMSYTPGPVIELTAQDMLRITESLASGPRVITLDLQSGATNDALNVLLKFLCNHQMPKGLSLKLSDENLKSVSKALSISTNTKNPKGSFNALYALQVLNPEHRMLEWGVIEYAACLFAQNLSFSEFSDILNHFQHPKIKEQFEKEFVELIDSVLCAKNPSPADVERCETLILIMNRFWPGKLELNPNKYWENFQISLSGLMQNGSKKEVDELWNQFVIKNELLGSPLSHSYLWQTLLNGFVEVYRKVDPASPHLQEALKAQVSVSPQQHPLEEPKSPRLGRGNK